jgi:acyl carrier protein phosphodiesterase
VGEATLVVELLDSLNGEILARAVDRRAAETFGGGLSSGVSLANRVDSVTAWNEVRQLADRWARVLTRRLDQLRTRSDMPGTSPTDPLR